jgi:dihydroorotate dehydrogenase (fumarate)
LVIFSPLWHPGDGRDDSKGGTGMAIDLTTQYGSLQLKSPIIVGACSLTAQEPFRIGLVSAGAGAIVLPCIFEEQFCRGKQVGLDETSSASPTRTAFGGQHSGHFFQQPEEYLNLVQQSTRNSPIPIIASLNGSYGLDWSEFAYDLQTAGAAAIEIQFHFDFETLVSPGLEDRIIEATSTIKSRLEIPLFLKLDRSLANPCNLARRLADHVEGVVLFGQSPLLDIDLDSLKLVSTWEVPHTCSIAESLASIRYLRHACPLLSIAANGGIGTSQDLIKALLMGANVANVTAAIYRQGATAIGNLKEGLIRFMEARHLISLEEMGNLIPATIKDASSSRAEYLDAVSCEWEREVWVNTPFQQPFVSTDPVQRISLEHNSREHNSLDQDPFEQDPFEQDPFEQDPHKPQQPR